ncbi:MAG: peptidylprolyl isomerase [Proteobacteria bacterium]|nr:peptidylprolyl isomerase [Pseudomonadota bacterium]
MKLKWILAGMLSAVIMPMSAHAETIERIAAVAGDDVITLNDVRSEGKLRFAVKGKDLSDLDASPRRAEELEALVKELVQVRLIARQAKKNNISVGDREVDMQMQEMYRQSGHGEEDYRAMLEQEGLDWASYRAYMRSEIEAQFVIRSELAGQVAPSESDVIACAQEKAPDAENSVTVTLRQILIPELDVDSVSGLSTAAGSAFNGAWWNSLDSAHKQYAAGVHKLVSAHPEEFVKYVHQYSTGRSVERDGLLGAFSPGDLTRDFAPVFALKKGEIAPLITSGAGYHVMMAEEVTEGESESWKRAKEQCRDQIAMRESQRLIESWLSDLLGKNYVSILVNRDVSGEIE